MNVLLATDSFPPVCGGSGWSTYELARGLRARGHDVLVVQPRPGTPPGARETSYDNLRVIQVGAAAPNVPFVRNYFKNDRLWATLTEFLSDLITRERIDIVHGQHVLTCLPSIDAAHLRGIPAVCTVRDYWPVCYWSDLIHTRDEAALCPACTTAGMMKCLQPRAGALWPAAIPMIPYMRGNLARKQRGLASADAVIAVSTTIAADLRGRAQGLHGTRIEIIPNPVDIAGVRARAATAPPRPGPYALYLGKLAPNKGTSLLIPAVQRARLAWPLVIAGDGPDRASLESAAAQSGHDITFTGWIDRDDAYAWLAHASMLIFPSRGPESLSRVLIEAAALGIPTAAMNTGGTRDIVIDGRTGLLSETPEELAEDIGRLAQDESLRRRLGEGAQAHASAHFDAPAVVARVEQVYTSLTSERP